MTEPEDLPRWVWDVTADLVNFEALHGKDERCLEGTLMRIPEDVRHAATVILRYRGSVGVDTEVTPPTREGTKQ